MLHIKPFTTINERLGRLLQEVERVHGVQSLLSNRVGNAVRDFPAQPTIWEAYEGRRPFDNGRLPPEFPQRFQDWLGAYENLAAQEANDVDSLNAAVDRVEACTRSVLEPLYALKEAMHR